MAILLTAHITLMIISLTATAGMALAALSSVKIEASLIRANVILTAVGTACGIALLIAEPVGAKCLVLASYTVLFALTYRFIAQRNQALVASSAS